MLGSTMQPPSSAEQDEAPCPVCSTDVGAQLGRLLQRYEQLQELVESVSARQAVGKAGRQRAGREQVGKCCTPPRFALGQVWV